MLKKIIKKVAATLLLSGFLIGLVFVAAVPATKAQGGSYDFSEQSGLSAAGSAAGYEIGADRTSIEDIISNVIYAFLGLIGIIFFGFVIYGGLTYMIAQGNEEKIKKATEIVMNSLFGLIITLAAYGLSYFLISYFWQ